MNEQSWRGLSALTRLLGVFFVNRKNSLGKSFALLALSLMTLITGIIYTILMFLPVLTSFAYDFKFCEKIEETIWSDLKKFED